MKEVWKPVLGFEDFYEVSSLGRVKSLPREIPRVLRGTTVVCFYKEKIRKPHKNIHGYFCLNLQVGKVIEKSTIHKLVYEAFFGRIPLGNEINHKDGVKTNNSLENLESCSRIENVRHAIGMGLRKLGPNGRPLLSEEDKFLIRFFYSPGVSGKNGSGDTTGILAKIFGVSYNTIYRIGAA